MTDRTMKANMKPNIHTYRVEGMTCSHCKASVEKGLGDLEGVSEVTADPGRDQVILQSVDIPEDRVRETIQNLGYKYGGMR